jgi:ferredoxin-fold anticodon binding domain-containing protein
MFILEKEEMSKYKLNAFSKSVQDVMALIPKKHMSKGHLPRNV